MRAWRSVLAAGVVVIASAVALPPALAAPPVVPETFGVQDDLVRVNDGEAWGSGRVWGAWCSVQPRADVDPTAGAVSALDHAFRVKAESGMRRLTVSLGHPAPWVFADHPASLVRNNKRVWFCDFHASVTSFPTAQSFAGEVGARYRAYVSGVITAAAPYLEANPGNLLVLQAWNEPNLLNGGTITNKIPGAARTWRQAAASLQAQERIMREVAAAMIPGRFEITTPSLYGKKTGLNTEYFKAQARSTTVDSVSLNFYTLRQKSVNKSIAVWKKRAVTAKGLVTRHKKLRRLPIYITETNHNLLNFVSREPNISGFWASPAVQKRLVEVTTMEALRLGYRGIQWYQAEPGQTAVDTTSGSTATMVAKSLRSELLGRGLTKCSTRKSVVTCGFTARQDSGPIKVTWSTRGSDGVTIKR